MRLDEWGVKGGSRDPKKKPRKPNRKKKTWERQREQEGCPPMYWPNEILKKYNAGEITLEQGHKMCRELRE